MAASKPHRRPKPHLSPGPGIEKQEVWQVQSARAHFARLIDEALAGRPQRIRRRGKDVVVLLAAEEYERLVAPPESLVDFFRNSPLAEAIAAGEIDLERDRDGIRDLEL